MKRLKVAILGAGASGIMAVIKLREMGQTDIQVFERASDIGGTWRDNRYPGIACDVPSHLYRYSFAPNASWSRVCASGGEILDYLRSVYEANDIAPVVTFNADVTAARYANGRWTLSTSVGERGPFDVVITAMGILRYPIVPDIEGLDSFAGQKFHTGQWQDGISLEGQRVGVIGTGSTATQLVPAIVDAVGKLSLFQRTPQWIMPVPNPEIPEEERESYRRNPALMQQRYEELGHEFNSKFAAAIVGENPRVYQYMTRQCQQNLERSVADPVLRDKLRPDYEVGCKRLVMSDGFYEAIQKPNAELVTERIERIEPRGVRTADGRLHELDMLVLATGYEAHKTLAPMQVIGRDGLSIDEAWAESHEAYLGVGIPGFPNFFMIGGPSSPIGNFSFLMTAENQFSYTLGLIELLASGQAQALEPTREAMQRFNAAVQERVPRTIWATGCKSWYMDKKGNIASWPWTYERFQEVMRKPDLRDFELHTATVG